MAQVPYSPVPVVGPTEAATPKPSINAPAAAFGAATGEAMSRLGAAMERSGDELFSRAIAIQNLNNETEARAADSDYILKSGELHAQYNALQGKDRVDAYPKYASDLDQLRQKIAGSVSNPAARRIFEASSRSTMARSIFSAAAMAASANKEWTIGTVKSQLELDVKTIEDNPQDEGLFLDKVRRIEDSAKNLAAQSGIAGGPQEEALVLKAKSKAWSQRIIGMSRVAPFEAAAALDKNKTAMTQDDWLRADGIVRTQARAVGANGIATSIYSPDKTLSEMEAEVKAEAAKKAPNDPILGDQAVSALRTKYNQDRYAKRQEELTAKQDIAGLIQEGNPQNLQELLAIPGADAAFQRLSKTDQAAIPGQINRYQSAKSKYDNETRFTELKGMAASDDPNAREEFLNLDPTKDNLSQPQMRAVMELQRKLKANTSGDPRVQKAVGILRGSMGAQLEALGIYRRTDANKDEYDRFTGALSGAIDVWQETHGKPPTAKDINETIGPQIIRERTEPWLFGLATTKKPFFQQTVPEEFAAAARREAQNPNLPEAQIYNLWLRMQYKKLYAKPPQKTDERVPQVPQSQ